MLRSLALVLLALIAAQLHATPPAYQTFKREQRIQAPPHGDSLMRIWVMSVGQGDALLIQLPTRYNYMSDLVSDSEPHEEVVDILVDAGAFDRPDQTRANDFLMTLYPAGLVLEAVIISHHDSDHVAGLSPVLENTNIGVQTIYHNGLASYVPGVLGFPGGGRPQGEAVFSTRSDGEVVRWMAFVSDGILGTETLVDSHEDLAQGLEDSFFQGVYATLASAIIAKDQPFRVASVRRAGAGRPFVDADILGDQTQLDEDGIHFQLLWPGSELRDYGSWGETINGNSITFRLEYGEFQMLFTGDHNEKSEQQMLNELPSPDVLDVDVLKVPHHGSAHAFQGFFTHEKLRPVVSVASMGSRGFKSKALGNRSNWQHPSTDVISWLGGAHRVYHTYIHERRFDWDELKTAADHDSMIEDSHVLIETDGEWFRVVEVVDPSTIPSVEETRRGNGTRWIRAR